MAPIFPDTVVAKSGSDPNARASSLRVLRTAGALFTRAATPESV